MANNNQVYIKLQKHLDNQAIGFPATRSGVEIKIMKNLVKVIREFNSERDWEQYHSPKNLAIALMVEAAELAEHFQWLTQQESHQIPASKREAVKDEIGDVLIYLLNLADKCGIDPLQAAHDKIEKNRTKYPADKVRGKHSKYNEYE